MKLMEQKEAIARVVIRGVPQWLTAMHLTWLRFIMVLPLIMFLTSEHRRAALYVFILAALLDYLDGPLARYRHQVSTLGKLLDPLADKCIAMPVVMIVGVQFVPVWLIILVVSLELLLILMSSILKIVFAKLGISRPLGANIFGKIKFTIQVIACILMLVVNPTEITQSIVTTLWLLATVMAVLSIIKHVVPSHAQN